MHSFYFFWFPGAQHTGCFIYITLQWDKGGANRVAVSLGSYDDHELPFSFFLQLEYHFFRFYFLGGGVNIANWFFALMDMDGRGTKRALLVWQAGQTDMGAAQRSVSCGYRR